MNILPDDPKLTAFALGELDAAEAAQIAAEIDRNPELRDAVQEIRQTSDLLKKEFANESPLAFSTAEKEAILAQATSAKIVSLPHRSYWSMAGISAIAASVALIFAWQGWFAPQAKLASDRKKAAQDESAIALVALPPESKNLSVPEQLSLDRVSPVAKSSEKLEQNKSKIQGYAANSPQINTGQARVAMASPPPAPTATPLVIGDEIGVGGGGGQNLGTPPSRTPAPMRSLETFSATTISDERKPNSSLARFRRAGKVDGFFLEGDRDSGIDEAWDVRNRGRSGDSARYPKYAENRFQSVLQEPLSTFSIDVDTASYANVRRFLNANQLPPKDAVRIEELVNYFSYNYPQPKGDEPFSANIEVAGCPWNSKHRLVRIGLKGKEIAQDKRPPSNFVFLIDVSGSMQPSDRLPLIKQALRMLVKRMTENDRIAIVVYASSSGVVLESTSCANKEKILEALDRLEAGGSTNGGEGVQRAYALAEENFIKGGVNRVILCTDGDFNVGITDQSELIRLIQQKAKSGVFLSALGVGTDNYKDALMQKLADKGNGNYHYIDSMEEAQKVLIQQMNGTLVTIAKDVKIQIEFNPAQVSSYRLIGYEKRILAAEDFNNDKKDAGEIGAGHTVTALYEIVPGTAFDLGNSSVRIGAKTTADSNKPVLTYDFDESFSRYFGSNGVAEIERGLKDLNLSRVGTNPTVGAKKPIITYSFDESFLKYYGSNGVAAVETAMENLNSHLSPKEILERNDLLTLKLRYKKPDGKTSKLSEFAVSDSHKRFNEASSDFKFAAAVASFGMTLKNSEYKGSMNLNSVLDLAQKSKGDDREGYRSEFITLVKKARALKPTED